MAPGGCGMTFGILCGLHRVERLMRLRALKPARAGVDCRPIVVSASSRCRFECARPHLRGVCSEPQMDCRLHLRVDSGRLALWGRCHRSVLTPGGGLIDECRDAAQLLTDALVMRSGAEASLTRCCITPIAAANTPASIPEADGRSWCHLLNEPLRQCLGQRHD